MRKGPFIAPHTQCNLISRPPFGAPLLEAKEYKVWLWRVPIVVTVDDSATWNPREPWIDANCHDVYLDRPCYVARARGALGPE